MMQVDRDFPDAVLPKKVEIMLQDGSGPDSYHRFRAVVGQRTKTPSIAGGKHQRPAFCNFCTL
jgi:hypothetical protein